MNNEYPLPERYRIDETLASRTLSRSFRATDLQTGDRLAVKTAGYPLWVPAADRLTHQKRVAERLLAVSEIPCSALPRIREIGETSRGLFYSREWIAGSPMSAVLQEHETLIPEEISRIARGCAAPVDALAEAGLRHGAISAENIIVCMDGSVYLTDGGFTDELCRFSLGSTAVRLQDRPMDVPDISALATLLLSAMGEDRRQSKDPVRRRMVGMLRRARKDPRAFETATMLAEALTNLSSAAIVRQVWRPATTSGLLAAFGTVCVFAVSEDKPKTAALGSTGGSDTANTLFVNVGPSLDDFSAEEKGWLSLEIRRRGVSALLRPNVADAFQLDVFQRSAIATIVKQRGGHLAELLEQMAAADRMGGHKLNTRPLRERSNGAVMASLTPSQRALWKSLARQELGENEPLL